MNGKLVTARRSVALSGQHSELLEQPEEIVAVQFPGMIPNMSNVCSTMNFSAAHICATGVRIRATELTFARRVKRRHTVWLAMHYLGTRAVHSRPCLD
jgi:hypothetical protein